MTSASYFRAFTCSSRINSIERIFVTGPLSELQIGPSARNIAGARHSGIRITAAFNKESIPYREI